MSKAAANYLGIIAGLLLAAQAGAAGGAPIVSEELRVASDPGIELHLRNKHIKADGFTAENVVLFVHGATFPASSTSTSICRAAAGSTTSPGEATTCTRWTPWLRGFDAAAGHVAAAEANPPFAGVREAARDIGAAVDFILKRRGISRLTLIGWSWGTHDHRDFRGRAARQGGPAGAVCAGVARSAAAAFPRVRIAPARRKRRAPSPYAVFRRRASTRSRRPRTSTGGGLRRWPPMPRAHGARHRWCVRLTGALDDFATAVGREQASV
jgi:hypothetical protein